MGYDACECIMYMFFPACCNIFAKNIFIKVRVIQDGYLMRVIIKNVDKCFLTFCIFLTQINVGVVLYITSFLKLQNRLTFGLHLSFFSFDYLSQIAHRSYSLNDPNCASLLINTVLKNMIWYVINFLLTPFVIIIIDKIEMFCNVTIYNIYMLLNVRTTILSIGQKRNVCYLFS